MNVAILRYQNNDTVLIRSPLRLTGGEKGDHRIRAFGQARKLPLVTLKPGYFSSDLVLIICHYNISAPITGVVGSIIALLLPPVLLSYVNCGVIPILMHHLVNHGDLCDVG